jgi:hypothetical protein
VLAEVDARYGGSVVIARPSAAEIPFRAMNELRAMLEKFAAGVRQARLRSLGSRGISLALGRVQIDTHGEPSHDAQPDARGP